MFRKNSIGNKNFKSNLKERYFYSILLKLLKIINFVNSICEGNVHHIMN